MTNHAEHSGRDSALGLLLAGEPQAGEMEEARMRLATDAEFREEFESLQRIAAALTEVGEAMHLRAGQIDIRDSVLDSITHLAFEQLGAAEASPYAEVEQGLRDLKLAFDARAGQVSLVDEIMAAVAAGRKSEAEVERPFARVVMELNSLGTAANAAAPHVDMVDPVMRKASGASAAANVKPLRARPAAGEARSVRDSRASWTAGIGLAAAAALCVGAAWLYTQVTSAPETPTGTQAHNVQPDVEAAPLPTVAFAPVTPYSVDSGDGASGPQPGTTGDSSTPRIKEPLTLQDAINARRRALLSQDNSFEQLASLSGDEANELLKTMALPVEALLGAIQYLPDEDAIAALREAIAENPDDPHLKLALALRLEGDPAAAEERMEYLAQVAASDPENSLPNYLMASDYFARGEMALGLDALSRGAAYNNATAYTLESARQREAALIASGLGRDEARFLAMANAGTSEYTQIAALRDQLLDYGAFYEGQEDFDTARDIYTAIDQLGIQLYEGAALAVEQQYGLETRYDAISAIQGIAEAIHGSDYTGVLGQLAGGIVEVTQYITARQELITNTALANQLDWTAYLNHIIANGDLDVANFNR